MGVCLKTENEAWSERILQKRGSEGGRRGLTGTSIYGLRWGFPGSPPPASPIPQSGPRELWLLRFSVLRQTPVTFAYHHFKALECYPLES